MWHFTCPPGILVIVELCSGFGCIAMTRSCLSIKVNVKNKRDICDLPTETTHSAERNKKLLFLIEFHYSVKPCVFTNFLSQDADKIKNVTLGMFILRIP